MYIYYNIYYTIVIIRLLPKNIVLISSALLIFPFYFNKLEQYKLIAYIIYVLQ